MVGAKVMQSVRFCKSFRLGFVPESGRTFFEVLFSCRRDRSLGSALFELQGAAVAERAIRVARLHAGAARFGVPAAVFLVHLTELLHHFFPGVGVQAIHEHPLVVVRIVAVSDGPAGNDAVGKHLPVRGEQAAQQMGWQGRQGPVQLAFSLFHGFVRGLGGVAPPDDFYAKVAVGLGGKEQTESIAQRRVHFVPVLSQLQPNHFGQQLELGSAVKGLKRLVAYPDEPEVFKILRVGQDTFCRFPGAGLRDPSVFYACGVYVLTHRNAAIVPVVQMQKRRPVYHVAGIRAGCAAP